MPLARLLIDQQPTEQSFREPNGRFCEPFLEAEPAPADGPYLDSRSVTKGFAALYERLRNTLDYRDEHLIRVFAFRRILKRRLIRGMTAEKVAEPLLRELVRSGYVPQTAIPESDVPKYQRVLAKYITLFSLYAEHSHADFDGETWDWIFTLAANELESRLIYSRHRHTVAGRLIAALQEERILERWQLAETAVREQTTIAVYRTFLKLPNELISWQLFLLRFPEWTDDPGVEFIESFAGRLTAIRKEIEQAFRHGAADRLEKHIQPVATTLWLLQESLAETPDRGAVLCSPALLNEKLDETIAQYSKTGKSRLRRTLWRSLTYIILTKMALALLLEVPLDRALEGVVNYTHIAFNIAAPPLLLLLFGLSVRWPGKKNTDTIHAIAEKLLYTDSLGLDQLRGPTRYRKVWEGIFNLSYSVVYLVSFGVIIYTLLRFGFTPPAVAIFLFFLTIVSFFGFRIRRQAQEMIVHKGEERFVVFLAALFFLPILRTGRWISRQSARINIFLFLFDVFIEVPLQAFLEFFDAFTGFVREKKEDISL